MYVEGEIEVRSYTNKENKKVYARDIIVPRYTGIVRMLDPKASPSTASESVSSSASAADEEIPF